MINEASFSRSQFPQGGWQFYQPQTNWTAPSPLMYTFDGQVNNIIKHRLANGAIVARDRLATDPVSVGNELEAYTRQRLGIPSIAPQPPKTIPPRSLPQAAAEAVAAVAKTAEGIGLLIDWLGGGAEVVAPALAHRRAQVCDACPQNSRSPFTDWFTVPVAERLRKMVEARKELKLTTPIDDKLGTCVVCRCPLPLKVHVPMPYIIAKTKADTMAAFPVECWIKREDQ